MDNALISKDTKDDFCRLRSDVFNRLLAKFIDVLIFATLSYVVWPVGFVAGITYLLIADGFFHGQSLGKRLIGLRVVVQPNGENPRPTLWRDSLVRNLPVAVALFLSTAMTFRGFVGFLLGILGALVIVFETYFIVTDDRGIRLGDIFANTQVLDGQK